MNPRELNLFPGGLRLLIQTNSLSNGIIYRRFRPTLNAILLDSELVRFLETRGMIPLEGKKLKFEPATVAHFVEENGKAIRAMKASLLFNPHKMIDEHPEFDDEQKTRKNR